MQKEVFDKIMQKEIGGGQEMRNFIIERGTKTKALW